MGPLQIEKQAALEELPQLRFQGKESKRFERAELALMKEKATLEGLGKLINSKMVEVTEWEIGEAKKTMEAKARRRSEIEDQIKKIDEGLKPLVEELTTLTAELRGGGQGRHLAHMQIHPDENRRRLKAKLGLSNEDETDLIPDESTVRI